MKEQIRNLILKLEKENQERSKLLEDKETLPYTYTATVHKYNNTLDILKQLKDILLSS